jgi:hypothetical protein
MFSLLNCNGTFKCQKYFSYSEARTCNTAIQHDETFDQATVIQKAVIVIAAVNYCGRTRRSLLETHPIL